jgi:hypothetical protein
MLSAMAHFKGRKCLTKCSSRLKRSDRIRSLDR